VGVGGPQVLVTLEQHDVICSMQQTVLSVSPVWCQTVRLQYAVGVSSPAAPSPLHSTMSCS
jgi:hypothetical protein